MPKRTDPTPREPAPEPPPLRFRERDVPEDMRELIDYLRAKAVWIRKERLRGNPVYQNRI